MLEQPKVSYLGRNPHLQEGMVFGWGGELVGLSVGAALLMQLKNYCKTEERKWF